MTQWTAESVRTEVSEWLEMHWNANMPLIDWRRALAKSGWGMPSWSEEWFGKNVPQEFLPIVAEEFSERGVVGLARTGIRILAAETLLAHGNDEQKHRFIQKILTGEEIWCQLFSEPGSGSDLAGSTMRADFDGSNWRINGQKVWTTSAHHAHFGLLLARSDWDVPKHEGLSYFVIDMQQSGVDIHQLKQMNGYASFNQVFFSDAIVPAENQIGKTGQGWQIAMTTLMHERRNASGGLFVGVSQREGFSGTIYEEERAEDAISMEPYTWYPQRAGRVDLAVPRAQETGRIKHPTARQELAKLLMMSKCAEWTSLRARAAQEQGQPQGPEGSLGKLAGSQIARQASVVHTLLSDADAMLTGSDGPMDGIIAEILISVPAISIAGGTDEIQKNIIAERVLGMEKEPRMDRGPFREVRRN